MIFIPRGTNPRPMTHMLGDQARDFTSISHLDADWEVGVDEETHREMRLIWDELSDYNACQSLSNEQGWFYPDDDPEEFTSIICLEDQEDWEESQRREHAFYDYVKSLGETCQMTPVQPPKRWVTPYPSRPLPEDPSEPFF